MKKTVEKVSTPVKTGELAVIEKETSSLSAHVRGLSICSQQSLETAVDLLKNIVATRKKAEGLFDPQIKAAHGSWQIALKQKNEYIAPILEIEKIIKEKKTGYELEQERIFEEAQRKAAEEARLKEEKIRAKLLKRIDKTDNEEKQALLYEQMENVHVIPEVLEEAPAKVNGMAKQADWKVTVSSLPDLLRAILNGEVPINVYNLVDVKMGVLKTYLKLSGKNSIPGCTVEKTYIQKVI